MNPEKKSSTNTITFGTLMVIKKIIILEIICYSEKWVLCQNVNPVLPVTYQHNWFSSTDVDKDWF